MSNIQVVEQQVVKFAEAELLCAKTADDRLFLKVKDITNILGLTIGRHRAECRRIQEDPLLRNASLFLKAQTNGGLQRILHINSNYLTVWLSSINRKSLSNIEYSKLIAMLNWSLSEEFNALKYPQKVYQWEAELRDEIFSIGYFQDYKITAKEKSFSFGRVDLLAIDNSGQIVVIELKKHKNYNDTIQQCHRYVEGFLKEFTQEIKVIICTLDNDSLFLENAEKHGFEVYLYERKLELTKISREGERV